MDKKTDYALRAAFYLAEKYDSGEPMSTAEIAEACGAPPKFLSQILLLLKRNALISSTAGRYGGYCLIRGPEMISIAEILHSVSDNYYKKLNPLETRDQGRYETSVIMIDSKIKSAVSSAMSQISLADIVELKD